MTQVEERLVEALREIGKTAFAEHEPDCTVESLTGWLRTIVGPVLAEYDKQHNSDYPECSGDQTSCPENEGYGCCNTRTPSPASPSPEAEGQPQPFAFYDKNENRFWEAADNCRDYLSSIPEIVELYTREQMDALSSQAPKPASAGGESDERRLTASAKVGNTTFAAGVKERLVIECAQRHYEWMVKRNAEREIAIADIAAEADTATKREPWVCPAGFCERHGVIHV